MNPYKVTELLGLRGLLVRVLATPTPPMLLGGITG